MLIHDHCASLFKKDDNALHNFHAPNGMSPHRDCFCNNNKAHRQRLPNLGNQLLHQLRRPRFMIVTWSRPQPR